MTILAHLEEAVQAGARRAAACRAVGLEPRTVERWRNAKILDDQRRGPRTRPANSLSKRERAKIIQVLTCQEFRDLPPEQIVTRLADRGTYIGSESSFRRIMKEAGLDAHRGPTRVPVKRPKLAERRATAANQIWTWDITFLKTLVRGRFFKLYMALDIWSRKIVAHVVHDRECSSLATEMFESAFEREGIEPGRLTLHADNGSPMKGSTLTAKLEQLEVAKTHSRPRVSDDNPFSEALFRTVKTRPAYPQEGFSDLAEAQSWADDFVHWYNEIHHHSAIRFVTPASRHRGEDAATLRRRSEVYEAAALEHPERWTGPTRDWSRIESVTLHAQRVSCEV